MACLRKTKGSIIDLGEKTVDAGKSHITSDFTDIIRSLDFILGRLGSQGKHLANVHVLNYFSVMSGSLQPMDCNPPASCVQEIFQARILECVAMPFSRGSFRPRGQTSISYVSRIGRWVLYH